MSKSCLALVVGCPILFSSCEAFAAPTAAEATRVEQPAEAHHEVRYGPPPQDWRALGYFGGYGSPGDGEDSGGVTLGASFQYRAGPLVAGALAEGGGQIFGYSYTGLAAVGGIAARPSGRARVQLLGEFGKHAYTEVGRDWLFGNDPGADGSTAYAGGRFSTSYIFGRKLGHFELGAFLAYADDLSRKRVVYEYSATGDGWFDGGGVGDHVIGTSRLAAGIELGATRDIF